MATSQRRRAALSTRARRLVEAINEGDESRVEAAVVQLSQSKRIFAPLTFAIGALLMLFQGVRLLFSDWRLSLIQVLPAMWIWAAMLDLKLHVVGQQEFRVWYGPSVVLAVLAIALVSVASFISMLFLRSPSRGLVNPQSRRPSSPPGAICGSWFHLVSWWGLRSGIRSWSYRVGACGGSRSR